MDSNPNLYAKVGLFVMSAAFMLMFGWSWLKGFSILHPPQRFVVTFHDVAGLNNNAPVNINGVRVGQVEGIKLGKDKDNSDLVEVHLKISTEETTIPVGSQVTIQTQGLVGAKYIEITLPEVKPGESKPLDIAATDRVVGQDPVRTELIANKIATKLGQIFGTVGPNEVGSNLNDALKRYRETMDNINVAAKKLNSNMDRIEKVTDSITTTSEKIGKAADTTNTAISGAKSFFQKGSNTMTTVGELATDMKTTSKRLNRVLENPGFSGDLKETAQLARQTADSIGVTLHELNGTLKDPALRADVLAMLNKVNDSTERVARSVETVKLISNDKELRADVRASISQLHDAMAKLDGLVSAPGFEDDLKSTMSKVKHAAGQVDEAAERFNQVMAKPQPLLRMLFTQPGKLPEDRVAGRDDGKTK